MPKTYEAADSETTDLMAETMHRYHKELHDCCPNIGVFFVYNSVDGAPALMHGGYQALAIIRIISLKDRVAGMPDATLLIDGKWWKFEAAEEEKMPLLDHELHHLIVQRDKGGAVKTDDIGRPVFKIRKHDFEFGGFTVVAERHKEASQEAQAVASIGKTAVEQGWLPGF